MKSSDKASGVIFCDSESCEIINKEEDSEIIDFNNLNADGVFDSLRNISGNKKNLYLLWQHISQIEEHPLNCPICKSNNIEIYDYSSFSYDTIMFACKNKDHPPQFSRLFCIYNFSEAAYSFLKYLEEKSFLELKPKNIKIKSNKLICPFCFSENTSLFGLDFKHGKREFIFTCNDHKLKWGNLFSLIFNGEKELDHPHLKPLKLKINKSKILK